MGGHPSSPTDPYSINKGCTFCLQQLGSTGIKFSRNLVATSDFRRHKGGMKVAPCCGPIDTGRHRTKFNRPGDLTPGICSHLSVIHVPFLGHGQQNHHNRNKISFVSEGYILQFCTFCVILIKESCYFGGITDNEFSMVEKRGTAWTNRLALRKKMTAFRGYRFLIIFSCSMKVGLLTLCKVYNEYISREK